MAEIKKDYQKRVEREKSRKQRNPLHEGLEYIEIDEIYGIPEVARSCIVCHK